MIQLICKLFELSWMKSLLLTKHTKNGAILLYFLHWSKIDVRKATCLYVLLSNGHLCYFSSNHKYALSSAVEITKEELSRYVITVYDGVTWQVSFRFHSILPGKIFICVTFGGTLGVSPFSYQNPFCLKSAGSSSVIQCELSGQEWISVV